MEDKFFDFKNIKHKNIADENFKRIDSALKNGIAVNKETGMPYFTGYANTTLYDCDQYFEGIIQIYMGWDTKYIINAVKIYLEFQQDNGFSKRAIQNGYSGEEDHEMVKPFLSQISFLCLKKDKNLDWMDEKIFKKNIP